MNNAEYEVLEKPFLDVARPLMESLRDTLTSLGHGPFGAVEVMDCDHSRGLWFISEENPELSVDLMLNDGDEYGFEGVGLVLNCSAFAMGQVWAPHNYTEDVGMTTPEQVVQRLETQWDSSQIVDAITSEWRRVGALKDVSASREIP